MILAYCLYIHTLSHEHHFISNKKLKSCGMFILKAVDLAKRFCDGAAPRIINGCLRTFYRDLEASNNRV